MWSISTIGASDKLHLDIEDDGRGIQEDDLSRPDSLGILGMRERAQAVGAKVFIGPRPQGGTVVTLRMPLHAEDDHPPLHESAATGR